MTTEEKVKQIHQEFHTSFQVAEEQLMNVINKLQEKVSGYQKPEDQEVYQNLGSIFPNSKSVVTRNNSQNVVKKFNVDLNDYLLFKKEVTFFKESYPQYKLISYAQVDEILRKWDLYVGPTGKYVEQIPPQNGKEIVDYLKINISRARTTIDTPLCATPFSQDYCRGFSNLYICAPLSHFEKRDLNTLEREVYYQESPTFKMIPATKVMDPIVLAPLVFQSNIGENLKMFHVITAWGPEAEDSYVKEGGF